MQLGSTDARPWLKYGALGRLRYAVELREACGIPGADCADDAHVAARWLRQQDRQQRIHEAESRKYREFVRLIRSSTHDRDSLGTREE